jgi:hypothetical protein
MAYITSLAKYKNRREFSSRVVQGCQDIFIIVKRGRERENIAAVT